MRQIKVGKGYLTKYCVPLLTSDKNSYKIVWEEEDNTGSFSVFARREDGVEFLDSGTFENGIGEYILKNEIYETEGELEIYLSMTDSSSRTTEKKLLLTVEKGFCNEKKPSENESLISLLMSTVSGYAAKLSTHFSSSNPHNITKELLGVDNYDDTEIRGLISANERAMRMEMESYVTDAVETAETNLNFEIQDLNNCVNINTSGIQANKEKIETLESNESEIRTLISKKADQSKVTQDLVKKVDKAEGKGLSSNDFTDSLKVKLESLNNYDDSSIRDELQEYTVNAVAGLANETEMKNNKVTSISIDSTDTQYPSAKCVYDLIGNINTVLASVVTGGDE